jgi:dimethylhistidine N-methyltransferase
LSVLPVHADFTKPLLLPRRLPEGPRVGFFPGSTIGNFHPQDATRLLSGFARNLGTDGRLLIGVDLKKNPRVLHAAYNDKAGITAAFNRNLLERANRELEATFDVEAFDHHAFWNADASRIEMHLVSATAQAPRVAGRLFRFAAGESIHTENSYKYTPDEFHIVAVAAGFRPVCLWIDAQQLFGVYLLAVTA